MSRFPFSEQRSYTGEASVPVQKGGCTTLGTTQRKIDDFAAVREIECLLNDNHQKGKMMIMIMKTSGSQVDSTVVEGKRTEGGGRKMRDLYRDT